MQKKRTFEDHIFGKIKKANSTMAIIRRAFTYLDEGTFLLLYKSLLRPHLEYTNPVWAPYLHKHINSLENVQRRVTRQIPGLSGMMYEERLRKLGLPTLAYPRLRGDLIEVYKIANKLNCKFNTI